METGIQPIRKVLLKPNYLFALQFEQGFVFGRTVRVRYCVWKPYKVIDANANDVVIDASSHQSELRFRDPRNTRNSILYLPETTDNGFPWIMDGAIGIKPVGVRMYLRFPEGQKVPGQWPNVDIVRPSSGDDFGYIDHSLSPYEEPTDYVRIVIPPKKEIGAEYYNTTDRPLQPVLHLLFAVYWFEALTPDRHADLIRKIALRAVPAAFLTVGFGDRPEPMDADLMADWGVEPISLDEAARLGR